jgi:hypothetical protein
MRSAVLMIIALSAVVHAPAQSPIPAGKLHELREATVFVKVQTTSRWERGRTGSGFVIRADGDTGYIATNAHVIAHRAGQRKVVVVFNPGTAQQRTEEAVVVSDNRDDDLAILRVHTANLPKPISPSPHLTVRETVPVYVLGFPFGEALGSGTRDPEVTVSRGSVSSIRRSDRGTVELIQLDGELVPGNSGGPVVTQDGDLVGVAVAKVESTNIGFAIPAQVLERMTAGRVLSPSFDFETVEAGHVKLHVSIELADPFERIERVFLLLADGDGPKAEANEDPNDGFKSLQKARVEALTLQDGKAKGSIDLRSKAGTEKRYWHQLMYKRRGERPTYTESGDVAVAFATKPAPSAALDGNEPENFGQPAEELTGESVTKLPASVEDAAVAGGGRYLVLKLNDIPGLAVFDIYAGELIKIIRLPSTDFLMAAGGNTALVYFNENNLLQTWDLTTYEKGKTKPNPVGLRVTNIVMGHSRGDIAFVRSTTGSDALSRTVNFPLNVRTLVPIGSNGEPEFARGRNHSYRDKVHWRTDGNLRIITEWCTSHSPTGFGVFNRNGTKFEHRYDHDSKGTLLVGDDGRIYTATGEIYAVNLVKRGDIKSQFLVPAIGGSLIVGLTDDGSLTLYEAGKTTPLTPWGEFPDWTQDKNNRGRWRWGRDRLAPDRRITFVPAAGRVAFIPFEDDRIVLRPFSFQAALKKSGVDYLIVTSTPPSSAKVGVRWKYQAKAISSSDGIEYKLEFVPEGMKATAGGLITWTPKKSSAGRTEKVVLLIKDASGEQTYHTFDVSVYE